jgi:hypothetical protein
VTTLVREFGLRFRVAPTIELPCADIGRAAPRRGKRVANASGQPQWATQGKRRESSPPSCLTRRRPATVAESVKLVMASASRVFGRPAADVSARGCKAAPPSSRASQPDARSGGRTLAPANSSTTSKRRFYVELD